MAASVTERPVEPAGGPPLPDPRPGGPRPRQPRRPLQLNTATFVAFGMLAVLVLVVSFVGYLFVGSRLAAERAQDVLYDRISSELALAEVPVCGSLETGRPAGLLRIRTLGVDQVFVAGSGAEQTRVAPGLRHDSVLPGQAGLSVIVGRRATGGAPFAHLDQIRLGDEIQVTTGHGEFTYVVDLVRTSDAPAASIPRVDSRLTLVTSDPVYAPRRMLTVSAVLQSNALPACSGGPAVADDVPGQGSHGRGVALLLWTQALLVVAVGLAWASQRIRGRAVWIGGVPLLLAVLWKVDENLAALLPNTF